MNYKDFFPDLIEDDENVVINNYIADDITTLKKNYTILLDYSKNLEKKIYKQKLKIAKLEKRIKCYEVKKDEKIHIETQDESSIFKIL